MNVEELRILLKFEGIDLSNYSDDELNILIASKTRELAGLIGLDIEPSHRIQTVSDFKGKRLRLDFYPVLDLVQLKYNGCPLKSCKYTLNEKLGIITFKDYLHGPVTVKYLSGFSEDLINGFINPLIADMVADTLSKDKSLGLVDGVSSIKEGDVSVSYDTSNSRTNRINSRIEDIKNRFSSARIRWL